ncbi:hypothetical protein ACHQM5_029284 [Ranunculus cassubicifolius]
MAEVVVSFLIQKLSTVVEEDMGLLKGLGREISGIKDEFQSIRSFLRDADRKADRDQRVKEWVTQVRDVAYKIEDVLDEFFLDRQVEQSEERHRRFLGGILQGVTDLFKCFKGEHEIISQAKDIKARIAAISNRRQRYSLSSSGEEGSSMARENIFLSKSPAVGIEGPTEKLIAYVLEEDTRLSVVSIFSMGGLGKTTLAKKVYDNQQVKYSFPHRAWITVSQTFNAKSLLQELFKQLLNEYEGVDSMEVMELKQALSDNLLGKRYVVVLDDIRTLDAWKGFRDALPNDNESGSRIIVTTRFQNIACDTCIDDYGYQYAIPPLNLEDSCKLFYRKLDGENMSFVPEQLLQDPSLKFLDICKGVPLAIVAISGLLATKQRHEWDQVYHSLGSMFDRSVGSRLDDLRIMISFCYNDLPYHLKACFLYFSLFPENYVMQCSRLLRLWVAEGFVRVESSGMRLAVEDLARLYLEELIQRSFVHVEETTDNKKVQRCRLHDLMREFVIGKSRDQNFGTFVSETQEDRLLYSVNCSSQRRLSFISLMHNGVEARIMHESSKSVCHLRSLFQFRVSAPFDPFMKPCFSKFRLLKVLALENAELNEVPSQIENLFHLRYLSLRGNTDIRVVPDFVGKLINLDTLDLKYCSIVSLPDQILNLRRLRNLLLQGTTTYPIVGVRVPVKIYKIVTLEKLTVVDVDHEEEGNSLLLTMLGELTRLRKLAVCNLGDDDEIRLFASVRNMKYLRSFKVATKYNQDFVYLDTVTPPVTLQSLSLHGSLNVLPPWISALTNLEKLQLEHSRLRDDPIQVLEVLPNLVTLGLSHGAVYNESLFFSKGGFPRLKKLDLMNLYSLNEVVLEEGAMPVVRIITFDTCLKLEKVPVGIEHLTTLEAISHSIMPTEFVEQLNKHHWKTGHLPRIAESRLF